MPPDDRPTAAFVLSLIAAVFHLLGGVLVLMFATVLTLTGFENFLPIAGLGLLSAALALVFIVLAFAGALWIYSGEKSRATQGGVLTLLISILALPTLWGLIIGSILGFVGAILALVWEPPSARPPTWSEGARR